VLEILIT